MKRTIIIMAKVPVAGAVKTRLEPFLSPKKCAELAAAFLQDAETKAKTVCENTILAYAPAEQKNVLENFLHGENTLVEQTGATLGERMENAFGFAFVRRSGAVVMIGTDSPTLPAEFIERAFEILETDYDLVLGKAKDGGFYLIGGREIHSELFANVEWSSAAVFEQTKKNAEQLNLRWRETPDKIKQESVTKKLDFRLHLNRMEHAQPTLFLFATPTAACSILPSTSRAKIFRRKLIRVIFTSEPLPIAQK